MADEKTDEITYTDVPVYPMPEWKGERVMCRAKLDSPGNYKLQLFMPVPATDEESVQMYGKTRGKFVSDGVVGQSYKVKGQITDYYKPLVSAERDLNEIKEPPPMSIFIKIEREKKDSEAKKTKEVMAEAGVTTADDLKAQLAELRKFQDAAKAKKGKKQQPVHP